MGKPATLNPHFVALVTIIVAAAIMRILPHPPNFTPVAAMALFSGAYFARKYLAFLIPMIAMLLSDIVLGFTSLQQTIFIYGSFALIVCLGILIQQRRTPLYIGGAALLGSVLFFVITNFAVWLQGGLYPMTFDGLITCYVMAIPFFTHTLAGDAMYTLIFFGGFALVQHYFPILRDKHVATYAHG